MFFVKESLRVPGKAIIFLSISMTFFFFRGFKRLATLCGASSFQQVFGMGRGLLVIWIIPLLCMGVDLFNIMAPASET